MPYHVPPGWRKFVYDSESRVFEIVDDFELRACGKLEGIASQTGASGVSFHPQRELAAFVTEEGMAVSDFHGNYLWEYKAPVAAVLFSRSGDEVWIAENTDSKKLFISLVDTESGMENSANTMDDPLYNSFLALYHAPETVLLELSAGQDGCEIWELDDTDSATQYRVVFPSYSHIMPAFRPDGKRLLTLENDEQLFYSYSWPGMSLVARQRRHTEKGGADEEAAPGYSIVYLNNGLAVVQSESGRLYLLDPEKMERLEELVIAGFEPVPIHEVFPNLSDDGNGPLFSPIEIFGRLSDVLVAITNKRAKNKAIVLLSEDELVKLCQRPKSVAGEGGGSGT